MTKRKLLPLAFLMAALALTLGTMSARARSVEEFYKGRQIRLIVYSGPGSAYDLYARLLARHMGRHIPGNPTFVTQNMVGAGGLKAIEYLYRIAPQDGSVIGTVGRGLPFEPMLGKNEVNFDPAKLTWLGSMNREVSVALSWHTAKVKSLEDLLRHELLIPGTGPGADSEIIPLAINDLVGTKFKLIRGYRNTTEAALGLERGELEGIGYWALGSVAQTHPDWLRDKKINVLFHTGVDDLPQLPGVPRIREAVRDDADRKALEFLLAREVIGRPFVAPPSIPEDRARALRDAFMAMVRDPEFLRDAERSKMDIDPVSGEEVDALLKAAAASPPQVIERVKTALDRN